MKEGYKESVGIHFPRLSRLAFFKNFKLRIEIRFELNFSRRLEIEGGEGISWGVGDIDRNKRGLG